jgi:hypothetical protein
MVDENEKKTKRNVVGRRGHQVTTADEAPLLPLTSSQPERPSAPPRSGNLLLPPPRGSGSGSAASIIPSMLKKFNVRDKKDVTAKRRFRVQVPTRMLKYVVLVFFVLPLVLFIYREMHLHDEVHHAHYKPEHYMHVDTQEVLFHLLDKPANSTTTTMASSTISLGSKDASKIESLAAPESQSQGQVVVAADDTADLATQEEARKEDPKVFFNDQNATATTPDTESGPKAAAEDPPEKEAEIKDASPVSSTDASQKEPENRQRKRLLRQFASSR